MCEAGYVALCGTLKEAFLWAVLVFLQTELTEIRADIFGDKYRAKSDHGQPK